LIKNKPVRREIPTETVSEFKTVKLIKIPSADSSKLELEQSFEIKPLDLENALREAYKKIEEGKKRRSYPTIKQESEAFINEFFSKIPGLKEASSLEESELLEKVKSIKTSPKMPASEIWERLSLPKHPLEPAEPVILLITKKREPGSLSENIELNLKVRTTDKSYPEDFSGVKLKPVSKMKKTSESVEIKPQQLELVLKEAAKVVDQLKQKGSLPKQKETDAYIDEVLAKLPDLRLATQLEEVELREKIKDIKSKQDLPLQDIWKKLSLPTEPSSSALPDMMIITKIKRPDIDEQEVELKLKYSSSKPGKESEKEVVILKSWQKTTQKEQQIKDESDGEKTPIKMKPVKRQIPHEIVSEFKTVKLIKLPSADFSKLEMEESFEIKPIDLENALREASEKIEDGKMKRNYPTIEQESEAFLKEFFYKLPGLKEASSLEESELLEKIKYIKMFPSMPVSEIWEKLSLPKHPLESAEPVKLIITKKRDSDGLSENIELNLEVKTSKENYTEDFSGVKLKPVSKMRMTAESVEIKPQQLKIALKEAATKVDQLGKTVSLSKQKETDAYIDEVLACLPDLRLATPLEDVKLRETIRDLKSNQDLPLKDMWNKLSLPTEPSSSALPEKMIITKTEKPNVDEQEVELKLEYPSSKPGTEPEKEVVILKSFKKIITERPGD
jgi:hypothetical protein